jgi:predicted kinase
MARRAPALILVCGAPGAGKSTLARALLRRFAAVWLNSDDVIDAFFPGDRASTAFRRANPRFFAAIYAMARRNLAAGLSVLLDMPHVTQMRDPAWRRRLRALCRAAGARLVCLKCVASPDALKRRVRARGERRDRPKLRDWEGFLAALPPDFAVPFPHAVIDMERPLARCVEAALAHIGRTGERVSAPPRRAPPRARRRAGRAAPPDRARSSR